MTTQMAVRLPEELNDEVRGMAKGCGRSVPT